MRGLGERITAGLEDEMPAAAADVDAAVETADPACFCTRRLTGAMSVTNARWQASRTAAVGRAPERLARLEGFEPPTNGFGSHYSIRLSYRRAAGHYAIDARAGAKPGVIIRGRRGGR